MAGRGRAGQPARLAGLDRYLRFLKYGVLAWAVTGAAVYGFMVFRDYDPWAALWNLLELSIGPGVAVLALTLIGSLFVERPWCRYACPLGAATGLVGALSPFYLKREVEACKACAICTKACPMGVAVRTATTIKSADCIGCLECVDECPREGALELKLGCLLYTSDAADERSSVDLGGRRIIKKNKEGRLRPSGSRHTAKRIHCICAVYDQEKRKKEGLLRHM